MLSSSLLTSPNYVLRIRCLVPPNLSPSSTLLLKPTTSASLMNTTTKAISSTSFGFDSPKTSRSQGSCNVCKRQLYSFEEILVCRLCHGSYHWRCVRPDTLSHFGENAQFICDKCNDNTTIKPSPTFRLSNAGIRIKSPNLTETDYREFASIPGKLNSTPTKDTNVGNTVRYFEEKQQQQYHQLNTISKSNEYAGQISSQINDQYIDDPNTIHQYVQHQQHNGLESDEEHQQTGHIHANYQYTPLKEYAALKSGRTTNDITTNSYQISPPTGSDHYVSPHYNNDYAYELRRSPLNTTTYFTSPTVDNLSAHNRQHFISTTNLNIHDTSSHRLQANDHRNSFTYSTPYLSQIRDTDSPITKTSYQQQQHQTDRHSAVGSDSGIVMVNSSHQHHANENNNNNPVMEQKLTDMVHKLGRQLETDAQKLNEKLEVKLKSLENMINQQTFVIRRQDEVIERLKSKILHIESERDHFRDRLSMHEQRDKTDPQYLTPTKNGQANDRKPYEQNHQQQQQTLNRQPSNASSTNTVTSRTSSKKSFTPHAEAHGNESAISKLIRTVPLNQEQRSSTPSVISKLSTTTPIKNKQPSTRLDEMIHQTNTNEELNQPSTYYNTLESHYNNHEQIGKKRSSSSSSSSSKSTVTATPSVRADTYELSRTDNMRLSGRTSNLHRSLESIPRKVSQAEQGLSVQQKATSLDFGTRPVRNDDPSSIYVSTVEAIHPASEYQNVVKGWLRKQNRNSFFKRIEPYYCVLSNDLLLMHKHENDKRPEKAINLRGAKVRYYEDTKHGPSLELTWAKATKAVKNYHLYPPGANEAEQWVTGIQHAIDQTATQTTWQQYRTNK